MASPPRAAPVQLPPPSADRIRRTRRARRARRARAFAGVTVLVVLAASIAVAVVKPGRLAPDHSSGANSTAPGPTTTPAGGSGAPGLAPGEVQVQVASLAGVQFDGGSLTLSPPFTITSAERGSGNGATIANALVGGQRVSIAWDAGQPLPVTGTGTITLVGVTGHGDGRGLTVELGQHTFALNGAFHLGSVVAVASGGLAAPQEAVDFTADATTRITFQGQASAVAHYPLQVQGPGHLELDGLLQAATVKVTRPGIAARLTKGPFALAITAGIPNASATATMQGAVSLCAAFATSSCMPIGPK